MKLQITFTPDQYWKIGFAAHCIALWLRLLFLLNSSRAKRRSKLAIHAAAKILPYYRRTNASLMGKNLQKKILFFFFNPHGTEKMPCYLDCFYSHVLRQNLPFCYHLKPPNTVFLNSCPLTARLWHLGVRNSMFSCAGGWHWGDTIFLNFLPPGEITIQSGVKGCSFIPIWYQNILERFCLASYPAQLCIQSQPEGQGWVFFPDLMGFLAHKLKSLGSFLPFPESHV